MVIIPKEEFESLIMEYLPITAEQIRDYAVFDEENPDLAIKCDSGLKLMRLPLWDISRRSSRISKKMRMDGYVNGGGSLRHGHFAMMQPLLHELTVRFAEDGQFSSIWGMKSK